VNRNKTIVTVVIIAAVIILGGLFLGKPTTKTAGTSTSSSGVVTSTVSISNYMFMPGVIKIKPGTTVTWTNQDDVNHTITADNVSSDAPSSMDVPKNGTYQFTFKTAGTYTYHCFPHPYMHGTVIVAN
jgi:plastocyanin